MVPPERNMTPKLQVRSRQGRVPSCFHDDQDVSPTLPGVGLGLLLCPFLIECLRSNDFVLAMFGNLGRLVATCSFSTRSLGITTVPGWRMLKALQWQLSQLISLFCNVLSRGEFITATPSQFGWPFIFWAFAAAGAMGKGCNYEPGWEIVGCQQPIYKQGLDTWICDFSPPNTPQCYWGQANPDIVILWFQKLT